MVMLIYDRLVMVNDAWDARTCHNMGAPGSIVRGREAVGRVVTVAS